MIHSVAELLERTHEEGTDHHAINSPILHQTLTPARNEHQIATLAISSLRPADSPRLGGLDHEHIAQLAGVETLLPPILVDRRTLRVIDGMHRLLAALARGFTTVEVEFFDGTSDEAFLCSVMANVTHGLPLSQADRRAAAARIIASQPNMSDRVIARASGLGAKAVASIRRAAADSLPQMTARVGMDGKVRPLDAADRRYKAAEVLESRPDASIREVARIAGISPATASDVRRRLREGKAPVPVRLTADRPAGDTSTHAQLPAEIVERKPDPVPVDGSAIMKRLLRDPSLRHKEEGRRLLRLLQQSAITPEEWYSLMTAVPPHSASLISQLARLVAESWLSLAQELDEHVRGTVRENTS
ncbi:transcriptional regulator [Kitasatospora sp. NPDC098663]|uniref:ParB/RepB/Spo0J family partition protein n=1 Tax=Kitasatospora sp. NPDC098663 TaxID=3364096 RepID=UPI0037F9A001